MHFDVVLSEFIHPCSKKRRRAQFSIRAELTPLSVCALQMCVRASDVCACVTVPPTITSVLYVRLVPSGSPYIGSWYVRLNENAHVGCNA